MSAGGVDEDARRVLRERAAALARPAEADGEEEGTEDVLTFAVAGEWYALATRRVCEVARAGSLTPVPGAPPPLVALTAWRGELLPVHDLRTMLSLPPRPPGPAPWLVVVGEVRAAFGVVADEVGRVGPLAPSAVAPVDGRPGVRGTTRDAVAVLDGDGLLGTHG